MLSKHVHLELAAHNLTLVNFAICNGRWNGPELLEYCYGAIREAI